MTVFPRIAALAAVIALVASGSAVASAQQPVAETSPSVLSVERYETPIDGWNGWLVWSRRNDNGAYTLIARNPAGEGVSLPVAPQPVPIDASIGPGPDGRPLIVYSRCSRSIPLPTGCDVFRLDPITGNGGRVTAASRPNRDERYPSVWGDKIAFSLTIGRGPLRSGVALADLDSTRMPASPTIFGPRSETVGGRTNKLGNFGPGGIDLSNGRLAFSWFAAGRTNRWFLHAGNPANGKTRRLLATRTTTTVVSQIGRPQIGPTDVVVPVLRTGGAATSEIVRTTFDGKRRWKLQGGFSAAQTEQYGSALTAVARTDARDLVVVRRLASDGRWKCVAPTSPDAGGCELLRYADAGRAWTRMTGGSTIR